MNITDPEQDPPLVLIVDDEKFTRLQLRLAMEQVGYRIVETSDGEQALFAYTQMQPDIVLLDALMPKMDGFTCSRQLKMLPGGDRTPILMITALEDQESVDRAFAAGATDYITKPIHWAVLRQRVYRLLQASRATEKLRQQTERARVSEERLRLALDAAHMGTWDWDLLNHKIRYSGTAAANIGIADNGVIETYESFLESVHPEDRQALKQIIAAAIAQQTDYEVEFRVIWADGSIHWIAAKGQVYYDETGTAIRMTGIDMDITDRKHSEAELQRQTLRSQLFADITFKIRRSLHIEEILQTTVTEVQKLLQCDRVVLFQLFSSGSGKVVKEEVVPGCAAIVGRNLYDPCFQQKYLDKYIRGHIGCVADIYNSDIKHCYIDFLKQFQVVANLVVPIFIKEKLWGLLIAHQCNAPRQWSTFEVELLQQLSDQIGIALAQAQLLEDETRQRQELTRANAELQQFASVASHDLQEPLRKIQAFGNRLKATYGDVLNEQGRDYLERMQNAAQRMQVLIDDLLTLSRIATRAQPFSPVNLTQVAQEVLSDLEILIQQTNGHVMLGELPTIDADAIQMRQLLQNLIGNALKFHQPDQVPIVKIYSKEFEDWQSQNSEEWLDTKLCEIIIEDNGIGFEEKYLDRIFNVFQRLHNRSEYEGTGMGLAICRKIAERHGGSITATSKPMAGAKFIVKLPIKHNRGD
ncbi:response regulator [Gloeocapsopsis dulcis]|uniref:histidine kinase n=1 Tax=Gloeocapsopsis dulcis AAB1 = 1H9 TaxID=1433147 RepID=A0A6N8FPI7_9CHRO|nr:response regulator [Gloeocapsopsis dulcis]MUL35051.1 histidine kinase [Gloeocapsopsis dulcis AAB1 = 1H9]WNN89871.1 response regulator [Gloeocapsopsis dulcis]